MFMFIQSCALLAFNSDLSFLCFSSRLVVHCAGTAIAYSVRDLLIQPDGGVKVVLLEGEQGKNLCRRRMRFLGHAAIGKGLFYIYWHIIRINEDTVRAKEQNQLFNLFFSLPDHQTNRYN